MSTYRTFSNNPPISIPSADVEQIGFTPLRLNPRTNKYETYVTYAGMLCPGFLVQCPMQVLYGPSVFDAQRGAIPAPAQTGKRAGAAAAAAATAPTEEKEQDGKPSMPLIAITSENDRCARDHGLDPDDIRAQSAALFAWFRAFEQKFVDFLVEHSDTIFGDERDRNMIEKTMVGMIKPKVGQRPKQGKTLPPQHLACKFAWGRTRLPQANKSDPPVYTDRPQNKTKIEMRQMQVTHDDDGNEIRTPHRVQMTGIESLAQIMANVQRNDMVKPVIVPKIWFVSGKAGITAEFASLMLYDKPLIQYGLSSDPFADSGDGDLVTSTMEGAAAADGEAETEPVVEDVEEVVEEEEDN